MDITTLGVDQLIKAYVALRDKKAEAKAAFVESMKPVESGLHAIECEMLKRMGDSGVDSMKTSSGTAYKSVRTTVSVSDKSAFLDFVVANTVKALADGADPIEAFDLLDVKANKTGVEMFLEANQELPPGVNMRREEVVGFRRS